MQKALMTAVRETGRKAGYRVISLPAVLILAGSALFLLSGCSQDNGAFRMSLAEGWTYAQATLEESPRQGRRKDFQPISFSKPQAESLGISGERGVFWFKKTFTIPPELKGKRLALVLGKPFYAAKVYLNGHYIGHGGSFPPRSFSTWNRYMDLTSAQGYFQEGENEILIHYISYQNWVLTGQKFLSSTPEVQSFLTRQNFLLSKTNALISALLLVMAIYHFYIYLRRRKDRENLWYALTAFGFALYLTNFFVFETPFYPALKGHYLLFQKIIYGTQAVIAFSVFKFTQRFLWLKDPRWIQYLLPITSITGLLYLLPLASYQAFMIHATYAQLIITLPVFLYIPIALIRGAVQKKKETLLLAAGLLPLLLTIISDLTLYNILENYVYLSGYGFPLFLLAVLFILGGRFVHDRNAADDLTEHLEDQVQAQTGRMRGLVDKVADTAEVVFQDVQVMTDTMSEAEKSSASLKGSADKVAVSTQSQEESLAQGVSDIGHIQSEMERINGIARNYYTIFEELDESFKGRMEALQRMEQSSSELRSKIDTVSSSAQSGRQTLASMQKSMQQINDSISQINMVTNVIKDISEQTNVLAINASIEASHAGERGSGFSVVAGEVKKLAGEVQKNAGQSEEIVKTVLKQVSETGSFTDQAVAELESIMKHFMETQAFYQELEGMLKDEFDSKQTMSAKISDLKGQMEGLLSTIQSERDKITATTQSFQAIEKTSRDIDSSTQQQNSDINQVTQMIDTVSARIKRTYQGMAELHKSLGDFGQEGHHQQ